jgi:hypothetical protein
MVCGFGCYSAAPLRPPGSATELSLTDCKWSATHATKVTVPEILRMFRSKFPEGAKWMGSGGSFATGDG